MFETEGYRIERLHKKYVYICHNIHYNIEKNIIGVYLLTKKQILIYIETYSHIYMTICIHIYNNNIYIYMHVYIYTMFLYECIGLFSLSENTLSCTHILLP